MAPCGHDQRGVAAGDDAIVVVASLSGEHDRSSVVVLARAAGAAVAVAGADVVCGLTELWAAEPRLMCAPTGYAPTSSPIALSSVKRSAGAVRVSWERWFEQASVTDRQGS